MERPQIKFEQSADLPMKASQLGLLAFQAPNPEHASLSAHTRLLFNILIRGFGSYCLYLHCNFPCYKKRFFITKVLQSPHFVTMIAMLITISLKGKYLGCTPENNVIM